ncbi:MAG: hypothetical protein QOG18_1732 [Microbacteriaceae bacterium]|jgi:hypothetical protein|nr:hypothetical protein [Microbacteriaceae bacterium]MDQ1527119.1 hypothetical protein [Microbacteriaceae bacterium]MDQ1578493.1 hypothetical protein [Microbacteriaceae bacterium]
MRGVNTGRLATIALKILTIFGALSAFGGAVIALSGGGGVPTSYLDGSPFASFVIPGLILGIVVGGTQTVAVVALFQRRSWAPLSCAIAGFGMTIWIFAELAIIGEYFWLQTLYFGLGILELAFVLALLGAVPSTIRPQAASGH